MRYVVWAQFRRRWRAWLAMGLLVGLASGAAIALAAGARRTESVYDRFLGAQNAFDIGAPLRCQSDTEEAAAPESCFDAIRDLPRVEEAHRLDFITSLLSTSDGRSLQPDPDDPCYSGPGLAELAADPDGGVGTDFNRWRLLEGRLADPDAADEVVVSSEVASRVGLHPGDRLVARYGVDCSEDVDQAPHVDLTVVGVGTAPFTVRPPTGDYFNLVLGTPALDAALSASRGVQGSTALVRLTGGDADVDRFLQDAAALGVPADGAQRQADQAEILERDLHPQAVALGLFSLVAALATVLVLGSAVARQARVDATDDVDLGVLGVTGRQRLRLAAGRGLMVGGVASVAAATAAIAASGQFPTGTGAEVEPDPGASVDALVLVVGVFLTVVTVAGSAMVGWWRAGATVAAHRRVGVRRPSRAADGLAGAGAPPTAVSGMRMALEPGRGAAAVPVRSSLAGVVIGFTLLCGAITFSASLGHLLHTPRLSGWNWDVGLPLPGGEDLSPEAQGVATAALTEAVAAQPGVTGATTGTFFTFLGGQMAVDHEDRRVAVLGFAEGDVGPTVVRGRAPSAPNEILLGEETLTESGAEIGDEVALIVADTTQFYFEDQPLEDRLPFTIVGTGVIPVSGGQARLGRGATTTVGGLQRFFPEAGPEVMWVRVEPDVDPFSVVTAVAEELGSPPPSRSEILGAADFDDQLFTVRRVDKVPLVLAGLVGVMAAGVLAHVVVTGIRARRRDLALLRTVGFVRRQVWATIGWQATVLTAMAVVVAVPVGVVAGRVAWRLYAEALGVVPEPVVPVQALLITAVVVFVVANLVALVPAWRAGRSRIGDVLRTE